MNIFYSILKILDLVFDDILRFKIFKIEWNMFKGHLKILSGLSLLNDP